MRWCSSTSLRRHVWQITELLRLRGTAAGAETSIRLPEIFFLPCESLFVDGTGCHCIIEPVTSVEALRLPIRVYVRLGAGSFLSEFILEGGNLTSQFCHFWSDIRHDIQHVSRAVLINYGE